MKLVKYRDTFWFHHFYYESLYLRFSLLVLTFIQVFISLFILFFILRGSDVYIRCDIKSQFTSSIWWLKIWWNSSVGQNRVSIESNLSYNKILAQPSFSQRQNCSAKAAVWLQVGQRKMKSEWIHQQFRDLLFTVRDCILRASWYKHGFLPGYITLVTQ